MASTATRSRLLPAQPQPARSRSPAGRDGKQCDDPQYDDCAEEHAEWDPDERHVAEYGRALRIAARAITRRARLRLAPDAHRGAERDQRDDERDDRDDQRPRPRAAGGLRVEQMVHRVARVRGEGVRAEL